MSQRGSVCVCVMGWGSKITVIYPVLTKHQVLWRQKDGGLA